MNIMKPIRSIAAARSTVTAVRRLAVSTSTFYASNRGAALLPHARVRTGLTATRSARTHAVALHG
jgi:hypothetical protein